MDVVLEDGWFVDGGKEASGALSGCNPDQSVVVGATYLVKTFSKLVLPECAALVSILHCCSVPAPRIAIAIMIDRTGCAITEQHQLALDCLASYAAEGHGCSIVGCSKTDLIGRRARRR